MPRPALFCSPLREKQPPPSSHNLRRPPYAPSPSHRIRQAINAASPRRSTSRQLTTAPTGAPTTGSSWASLARSMSSRYACWNRRPSQSSIRAGGSRSASLFPLPPQWGEGGVGGVSAALAANRSGGGASRASPRPPRSAPPSPALPPSRGKGAQAPSDEGRRSPAHPPQHPLTLSARTPAAPPCAPLPPGEGVTLPTPPFIPCRPSRRAGGGGHRTRPPGRAAPAAAAGRP